MRSPKDFLASLVVVIAVIRRILYNVDFESTDFESHIGVRIMGGVVKKRSAVSLFSGAGGLDVGFRDAGFSVVFANDIDANACKSYRANHGPINEGPLEDYFGELDRHKGVDIVFGGPPCQGFSVAGKMDPSDSRSKLIWSFMDVVAKVRPKVFVCENVKALGFISKWAFLRQALIKSANEQGYVTALIILNASDFGVPQSRERMFLVGVHAPRSKLSNEMLQAALLTLLESEKSAPETVGEVISRLGPAGSVRNSRICNAKVTFAKAPVLRKSAYAGMLFNGAGRPVNPCSTSPTLAASMGGNKTPIVDEAQIFEGKKSFVEDYHRQLMSGRTPKNGVVPKRLRRLTVDECLAFQTFPADYEMVGSQSSVYKQIGNAVPCKLAGAVARVVKNILDVGVASWLADEGRRVRS